MLSVLSLFLFLTVQCNIISISLNKIVSLPKGSYSSIEVTHQLEKMDQSIFRSITTLSLQPSNRYSNEKFDVFRDKTSMIDCYLKNLKQTEYLYKNNKSCSANCSMNTYKSFSQSYVEQFNINSNESQINLIIDNTNFPCHNGTYYPQVDLYEEINTIIQPNMSYFYLYKALVLLLVFFVLICSTINVIMWVKYRNIVKALAVSRDKTNNRDNLDVIYTKIKQQNQVQSQQMQSSIRPHSNSQIMMRIN